MNEHQREMNDIVKTAFQEIAWMDRLYLLVNSELHCYCFVAQFRLLDNLDHNLITIYALGICHLRETD